MLTAQPGSVPALLLSVIGFVESVSVAQTLAAKKLAEFEPDVLVCQDFHDAGGKFGADTGASARGVLSEIGWGPDDYRRFVDRLRQDLTVYEAEAGFFPPPERKAG